MTCLQAVSGKITPLRIKILQSQVLFAVDEGGPRSEFFSLLHKEITNSSLFIGHPGKKCFGHNIMALEQGDFRMYGQLCSMGIIQGPLSTCLLAPAVVDYIHKK